MNVREYVLLSGVRGPPSRRRLVVCGTRAYTAHTYRDRKTTGYRAVLVGLSSRRRRRCVSVMSVLNVGNGVSPDQRPISLSLSLSSPSSHGLSTILQISNTNADPCVPCLFLPIVS
eukprot:scpid36500/ scgid9533/ 